jgi:hypothetical protein
MDFLKYDIKDNGAFAPFISTMEDTGADIEGSKVMFESDNSAAKMLADTLVEYEIMTPVMEATKPKASAGADAVGGNTQPKQQKEQATKQRAPKTTVADKVTASDVGGVVASDTNVTQQKKAHKPEDDPNRKEILENISAKLTELGIEGVDASPIQIRVVKYIDGEAKKAQKNWPEIYDKYASNPIGIGKMVFAVIQKIDPDFYEELKKSGKINGKGENTASIAQKNELSKAISDIVGEIEVPDAFNVEIDDSEWENAVIKSFGFPMINLTSPLVRDMLRAQDPKQQKRAYKEFRKQLKSDPDVAKALGVGVMGTLGIGGNDDGAKTDKKTRIDARTESVSGNDTVLVEGPISDIKNALKTPVDVLKSIAQSKGTPCHRNNLVVMYDDIDGKSGDSQEGVKVTPLGVSGGVLVDKNLSVTVPMSHLSAFYSVVDPKASFKSYAKAMAEVNAKSDNAGKGLGDAAAAAGKKLLSKIPLLGRGVKKEMAAQEADGITKAMGELAMYIKENGHPPFYLLKPKTKPKEIDKWSDEDAANGYQMITMLIDGRKAGMIMKESTANALFKVG